MLPLVVLLTCLGATYGRLPLSKRITVTREAYEGTIRKAVQATTKPDCGLVFIFDNAFSDSFVTNVKSEGGWRLWRDAASFQLNGMKRELNETQSLPHLVFLARQVRQLSLCTMVVVVSHDPTFLAAFAEWSLRGRLLVWSTRLVVVTRLAPAQLRALLPVHWTFSMMNALFLNVEGTSSSFTYFNQTTSCQVFSYLPYSPAGPQVAQVASWTHSRGLLLTEGHTLFQEKFSNFHGARVNVTALPYAPFWEERAGPNNTTVYSGSDYNTLEAIADACNFTFHVLPTSSWPEVTRLVEERVSFMAPVVHNVMPHRYEHYDFSFVYEFLSMDFSMAPPGLRPLWKALYYPLSGPVWLAILISLLLVPCFLLSVTKALSDKNPGGGGSGVGYGAVVQGVMGMLLGQSLSLRVYGTSSTRILVAVWLMFSIIFVSAYQGNLTASLTLPKYPSRPETLSQLVNAVKRLTMQQYGQDFKTFFSKSDSKLFQRLPFLIDIVPNLTIGQQQATENNQAHLDNRRYQHHNIAKRFTRADGSELLYIGRESILPGQSAWPLPHDAPYTALIDRHLMAVVEAGLFEKWVSDILFEVKQESRNLRLELLHEEGANARSRESTLSLTISHMQGAFMLLLLGLALAVLAFAGELIAKQLAANAQDN